MNVKKKVELVFCLCFAAIFMNSCKSKDDQKKIAENGAENKPNIIFILADDLGANDLSFAGSTYYETPSIDRIAKEGTIFTQGYAAAQVCSPSRASIMTGQYTTGHGITDWIGAASGEAWKNQGHNTKVLPPAYTHSLSEGSVTIAEAMKNAGYKTFFAGKWHLGEGNSIPENHGFEINKGGWAVGTPKGGYYAPWKNPKLEAKYDGESLTMRLAEETADFITQNKNQPFFAFLSFYAVHGPIETTEEKWKKYRNKAEAQGIPETGFEMERVLPIRMVQDNPVYAGLLETMDDAIGVVLDKLKELNLDKNTIIVFTSDNGGVASGDAYATTNLPLRGGKGYQWEGGIREPYLIKAPFLKDAPKTIDYPVSGIDFYPTLLDFAGITSQPTQKIDGISLAPLLKGESVTERPLFWHYPHYGNQGGAPVSIIRKEHWKLIHFWEDGVDELYNLSEDPSETNNVIEKNSVIAQTLRKELDTYLSQSNAAIPTKNPDYDESLAQKQYQKRSTEVRERLEKQRKDFLSKDFDPKNNWYDSQQTKD